MTLRERWLVFLVSFLIGEARLTTPQHRYLDWTNHFVEMFHQAEKENLAVDDAPAVVDKPQHSI
jgi:hypothetical protein